MSRAHIAADGTLRFAGATYRAVLGRGGVRRDKQEGDGATPAGLLPLRRVLYRADRERPPACAVPIEPTAPTDGWCDDAGDLAYNRPVTLPYAASHEVLWRTDALYDLIGVLGWNDAPPVANRGSAIFLHLASTDRTPTAGCVALARADLLAVLAAGLSEIQIDG